MPSEISELLEEARTGAPPPRYDVDYVWLAGRRRRRRRNAGWTIAAVVAVAAAIGVPQIVARRSDDPQPLKLPAPVVITTPKSGEIIPIAVRFHGYDAGGFHVEDPTGGKLNETQTTVTRIGGKPNQQYALLEAYAPGLDPLATYPKGVRAETDPINGRPAFWFTMNDEHRVQEDLLCWEYVDALLACIEPEMSGMTAAEMRTVAEGFTASSEREVKVPFKVGYLPSGWRLVSAEGEPGAGKANGWLRLEPQAFTAARFVHPDRQYPSSLMEEMGGALNLQVWFQPSSDHMPLLPTPEPDGSDPTKVVCDIEGCYHPVANGRYRIRAGGSVPKAEEAKVLASITMAADPEDESTWFPVHEAVPPSALVRLP
ncbi:hypothetical protein [Paractinoplanes durhamensis]|uniref:DUF4179 domain-containing protein n=1 Tax=Paractinoplanes durhamensis TaxID=113563 RepID=A0ABQ3Z104_9ACTN|nr:hypothetical protein [Actinoplanes durhamensis]GIE03510.1 hypothetical protein Adu01nite_48600 [Actinoplanes durhamensis]